MSVDVVGYCRMMEADEIATVGLLLLTRRQIEMFVKRYRGRVIDDAGDNVLAEFSDDSAALCCGVGIQLALTGQDGRVERDRSAIQLRIGLHSGQVLVHGGRLYGDVVNVAARLQGLAEPDCVFLSATTADSVRPSFRRQLDDLGEFHLKNIRNPLRILRQRAIPLLDE